MTRNYPCGFPPASPRLPSAWSPSNFRLSVQLKQRLYTISLSGRSSFQVGGDSPVCLFENKGSWRQKRRHTALPQSSAPQLPPQSPKPSFWWQMGDFKVCTSSAASCWIWGQRCRLPCWAPMCGAGYGCTGGNRWHLRLWDLGQHGLSRDSSLTQQAPLGSFLMSGKQDLRCPVSVRGPLINTPRQGRGETGDPHSLPALCGLLWVKD